MKIFLFLFNFYLLILSCLPCTDGENFANEVKTSISIYIQENTENKENHEDNCTPFCHCTCCASASFIFQTNNTEKIATIYFTPTKFSTLDINFSSNQSNIIWQPPKFKV